MYLGGCSLLFLLGSGYCYSKLLGAYLLVLITKSNKKEVLNNSKHFSALSYFVFTFATVIFVKVKPKQDFCIYE